MACDCRKNRGITGAVTAATAAVTNAADGVANDLGIQRLGLQFQDWSPRQLV
jgi:hypothetical protein